MPKKFQIDKKEFEGIHFNSMMASGNGRRLWVTYCDGAHFFKVEDLRKGEIILETISLNAVIREFNKN